MNTVSGDAVRIAGQAVGLSTLPDEVVTGLSQDIEYRVRELVQEAAKFMRHAKRTVLTTEDVASALRLRNIEPLYGFSSPSALEFCRAVGSRDLFIVEDKELDLSAVIGGALPQVPRGPALHCHWLAVNGVQPTILENPPPPMLVTRQDGAEASGSAADAQAMKVPSSVVEVVPMNRHVLSKEMQLLFAKLTDTILGDDNTARQTSFKIIQTHTGLQELLPYLCQFVTDKVQRSHKQLNVMANMLTTIEALLENANLFLDLYMAQLMPAVLTCLLAKFLAAEERQYTLRDQAAKLVALVCQKFGTKHSTLQTRVTRTMYKTLVESDKPLESVYGAIRGLAELGPLVTQELLVPNAKVCAQQFAAKQSDPTYRAAAVRCDRALLDAIAEFLISEKATIADVKAQPDFPALAAIYGNRLVERCTELMNRRGGAAGARGANSNNNDDHEFMPME